MSISPPEIAIVLLSLLLLIAAKPICRWLHPDNLEYRANMMRGLNLAIICTVLLKAWLLPENIWLVRVVRMLIVLYFAVFFTQLLNYLIRKRFGKEIIRGDNTTVSDTYASRGLSLVSTIAIGVLTLIACLQLIGFNSLLETGGALSIIGIFLALTQASWAPDIISGLIILNSRLCEEGEVIQLPLHGKTVIASVFKTKLFHTELLEITNNHRIMVSNRNLRDLNVHNLSRFASAKGLRECLRFNIDYAHTHQEVEAMFYSAFEKIDVEEELREEQYQPEIRVLETGDYAVTWGVFYYIKSVKELIATRQTILSYILKESHAVGISLSTPVLHNTRVTMTQSAAVQDKTQS